MTNLSNLRNALQHFDTNLLTPYAVGFDRHFDRLWDYASHQAESTGIHLTTFKEQMITSMKSKWHLLVSIRKTLKSNLKMDV